MAEFKILEQSFRGPTSKRGVHNSPLANSWVQCPRSRTNGDYKNDSVRGCIDCPSRVKINFNTVHCAYPEDVR